MQTHHLSSPFCDRFIQNERGFMLLFAFLLSITALILQSILPMQACILAFSPFLALVMLRCSLYQTLWLSALSGSILDLISSDPIGTHSLSYTLVSALFFRIRKMFLYEEPFHLAIVTSILSFGITIFELFFLFLFDRRVPFGGRWFLTDFLGMPLVDGFYAFVWFAGPLSLYFKCKKMWGVFWLRRKRISRTLL